MFVIQTLQFSKLWMPTLCPISWCPPQFQPRFFKEWPGFAKFPVFNFQFSFFKIFPFQFTRINPICLRIKVPFQWKVFTPKCLTQRNGFSWSKNAFQIAICLVRKGNLKSAEVYHQKMPSCNYHPTKVQLIYQHWNHSKNENYKFIFRNAFWKSLSFNWKPMMS